MNTMKLTSSAFHEGEPIPARFTCTGLNFSPPIAWMDLPSGSSSLALVCEDPDAPMGTFTHWVLYNMPSSIKSLPEGIPQGELAHGFGAQGVNDFRHFGYEGPCPPPGKFHRYYFTLFALDSTIPLPPGLNGLQLQKRLQNHILAKATLMGLFKR